MIIYHTTYHLSNEVFLKGLDYLKTIYVPAATRSGQLFKPRMQRVMNEDADVNGVSLSIQFCVADVEALNEWIRKEGVGLQKELVEKFNDEIVCFSTLLEEIDIS